MRTTEAGNRPDALHIAKATESKHWSQLKALTPTTDNQPPDLILSWSTNSLTEPHPFTIHHHWTSSFHDPPTHPMNLILSRSANSLTETHRFVIHQLTHLTSSFHDPPPHPLNLILSWSANSLTEPHPFVIHQLTHWTSSFRDPPTHPLNFILSRSTKSLLKEGMPHSSCLLSDASTHISTIPN